MLPVSLDCPFLIATSGFSNVYLCINGLVMMEKDEDLDASDYTNNHMIP
jgi:hypothetical protein